MSYTNNRLYNEMKLKYDDISHKVISPSSWIDFLHTSCYNYRLRFDSQLMIYAQKPNATAVLTFEKWNQIFGRRIIGGTKSIKLFKEQPFGENNNKEILHYYDVSDTSGSAYSKTVPIWKYDPMYDEDAIEILDAHFGDLEYKENIVSAISSAAYNMAEAETSSYIKLVEVVDRKKINAIDKEKLNDVIRKSIVATIMFRLDIDPKAYYSEEDFKDITLLDNPESLFYMGSCVNDIVDIALSEISNMIRYYDKHKEEQDELREEYYGGRENRYDPDVMSRRLLLFGPDESENVQSVLRSGNTDTIRPGSGRSVLPRHIQRRGRGRESESVHRNTSRVAAGESETEVPLADEFRGSSSTDGIKSDSNRERKGTSKESETNRRNDRKPSVSRTQSESLLENDLSMETSGQMTMNLFTSPEVDVPDFGTPTSNISILDEFAKFGANKEDFHKLVSYEYMRGKNSSDVIEKLKEFYVGSFGLYTENGKYTAVFDEKEIKIAPGSEILSNTNYESYTWEQLYNSIEYLLENGMYASQTELDDAIDFKAEKVSQSLYFMKHDMADDVINKYLPSLDKYAIFDNSPEKTKYLLQTPNNFRNQLLSELQILKSDMQEGKSIFRILGNMWTSRLDDIISDVEEFNLPLQRFDSTFNEPEEVKGFITENEILDTLKRGSGVEGGKGRIHDYFLEGHSLSEKTEFLKKEFGTGGSSPGWYADKSHQWHDPKGLKLDKLNFDTVKLNWSQVARKYDIIENEEKLKNVQKILEENNKNEIVEENVPDLGTELQEENVPESGTFFVSEEPDPEVLFMQNEVAKEEELKKDIVAANVGTEFILIPRAYLTLAELKDTNKNVSVDNKEYPLVHGKTFEDSRRIDFFMDSGEYETYKLNDYIVSERVNLDFWEIEFNETDGFIKNYRGEVLTSEILNEIVSLDKKISTKTPDPEGFSYYKFYFQHKVNGEITERFRVDIGDGVSVNRKEYELLAEEIGATIDLFEEEKIVDFEEVKQQKIDEQPGTLIGKSFEKDSETYIIEEIDEENITLKRVLEDDDLKTVLAGGSHIRGFVEDYEEELAVLRKKYSVPDFGTEKPDKENVPDFGTEKPDKDNVPDFGTEIQEENVPKFGTDNPYPEGSIFNPIDARKPKVKELDNFVPLNFDLRENIVEEVGKKERFRRNIDAIKVLKKLKSENRSATKQEQIILSKYVGWGGLSEAFGTDNTSWGHEYFELKNLLTNEEYESARQSTLSAFFTPPEVINAIYNTLNKLGFSKGNILEPSCGVGNFIGLLPDSMKESNVFGVELDNISAEIAKQLYQGHKIINSGFENVTYSDNMFDVAVGNVPFGDFGVNDKRYNKHHFLIHDYFFAKTLDKVRPGGVIAFVTSKGTMDKQNSSVRKYIAERADLLGAIRLPNNTFEGNAGTTVVSDILFLQKKDKIIDNHPDWVDVDVDENGRKMNRYFIDHPEMVLGEWRTVSGRFGPEDTVVSNGENLEELLISAVADINGEIPEIEVEDKKSEKDIDYIPATEDVQNFSYTIIDNKVYFRENSIMYPANIPNTAVERVKGMIGIRDSVRRLFLLQTEDYEDSEIIAEQQKLNTLYDNFAKKFGLIRDKNNSRYFSDDNSYPLISSLEILDENGELERKADIFTKRTIRPNVPVTKVDTAAEALTMSLSQKACVDMNYMCSLSGLSEEEIYDTLKGSIFKNPDPLAEHAYVSDNEYLSGNVRQKLAFARTQAEIYKDAGYEINIEKLESVQPKDIKATDISVRLGTTWIPNDVIEDFVFELLETPKYLSLYGGITVNYSEDTKVWQIDGKSKDNANVKAYSTYGSKRANAYKLIEDALNLRQTKVYDRIDDADGKTKSVINVKETTIAQAKQDQIKEKFTEWIWENPERRERLCNIYNTRFNSFVPREYDGSNIDFVGMNQEIQLEQHQKDAVAHILYGGNTLLAHCVGAGKTFEMAAAAMESKRLGLCTKSLFVVPNHLIEQWASEFLQLYPSANILVSTKKDFEKQNRKRFCSRIATGDYDAVIIGQSQFERIPLSPERRTRYMEEEIEEITNSIAGMKWSTGKRFSVKQLESKKKKLQIKLDKLYDENRKDDVVTFEELGVDRIFIDESHYYKNLFFDTKMSNVAGIPQTDAQKSSDLYAKCRYMDELTGGKGIIFATGTPISNSMVELYTIQRYLQNAKLKEYHLDSFDAWASTFGECVSDLQIAPEGLTWRIKTRLAKFFNIPELMLMFKEVADIKTADMLNLDVPKANYHNVITKASEMQREVMESFGERADRIRNNMVDPSEDNFLNITNDGRKLALDQRMLNDMLSDEENSKVNMCVNNIFDIWDKTSDKRSTQLVFCDRGVPNNTGEFSIYTDIKDKLVARGVPEEEIAFIHSYNTDKKKGELFQRVRKGDVRVLIGSTDKMGAGTNIQNKLIALHDLDCPWRPSDLEQRSGRIIRKGNENKEVHIFRYATQDTFDTYNWQLIESKQKAVSQIMTSNKPLRVVEDVDEAVLSYAEIKSLTTGNPLMKEKMDLDLEVKKLKVIRSNFLNDRFDTQDKIRSFYPKEIERLKENIKVVSKDLEVAKSHPKASENYFDGMTIKDTLYTNKEDAGNAILNECRNIKVIKPVPLGSYRGFKMELLFEPEVQQYFLSCIGESKYDVALGKDVYGNITRIDNLLDGIDKRLDKLENRLENTIKQFEIAKKNVDLPFDKEEEYNAKLNRLSELNAILSNDKKEKSKELEEKVEENVNDADMNQSYDEENEVDKAI